MRKLELAKRRSPSTTKALPDGLAHCRAVLRPCSSALRGAHSPATPEASPRRESLRPRALLPHFSVAVRTARIVLHVSSALLSSLPAEARPPLPASRHLPCMRKSTAMDQALAYVKSGRARTGAFAAFGGSPGKTQRGVGPLSELTPRVAPNRTHSSLATKRACPVRRCQDVCLVAVSKPATPSNTTSAGELLFGSTPPPSLLRQSRPSAPVHSE